MAASKPSSSTMKPALLRAAGDADDPAALDLRDLADDLADRTGRGRDDHGLAGVRLADLEQPEVGGHAGHAEHAEVLRRAGPPRRSTSDHAPAVTDRVLLHAERPADVVADAEVGMLRRDHPADAAGAHHLADPDRRDVATGPRSSSRASPGRARCRGRAPGTRRRRAPEPARCGTPSRRPPEVPWGAPRGATGG